MYYINPTWASDRKTLRTLLSTLPSDESVWRGDAGDLVIGDASDFTLTDDSERYTESGTVAEWIADLTNAD